MEKLNFLTEAKINALQAFDLQSQLPPECQIEDLPDGMCVLKFNGRFDFSLLIMAVCFGAVSFGLLGFVILNDRTDYYDLVLFLIPFALVSIGAILFLFYNLKKTWLHIYNEEISIYQGIFSKKLLETIPRNGSACVKYNSIIRTNGVENYGVYVTYGEKKYKINSYHGQQNHVKNITMFIESLFSGQNDSIERVNQERERIEKEIEELRSR